MISWLMEQVHSYRCSRMSRKSPAKEMTSDGAGGGGEGVVVGVHGAGEEGLLLHLQRRSRPMVAQLDFRSRPKANVQEAARVVLPAGQLVAIRGVRSNVVLLLVDLGFH